MPALVMTFLWSLLLQGGMLLGVRVFYKRWSPLKQRLVASFLLPVAVAAMAGWIWIEPASCPDAHATPCPATVIAVSFALRMVVLLLGASLLIWLVGKLRKRS